MARLVLGLKLIGSEDVDQDTRFLNIDEIIDDTLVTTWKSSVITLAPSASNIAVAFEGVTAGRYLVMLFLSGTATFKVNNNASQALAVEPLPLVAVDPILPYQKTARPGVVFVGPISTEAALTSLFLSNPSATVPARVQVAIVGEAA